MPAPALYDLTGPEASRSPEWQGGIERLMAASLGTAARGAARALSRHCRGASTRTAALRIYPGSPAIVRALLRSQDRLIACETGAACGGGAGAQSRRRPAQQGGRHRRLDRAQRLHPAEGAARPGADRPAVRGRRRVSAARARRSKPPIANGRAAAISSGTRSRSAASRMRWRGGCSAPGSARSCASN